MKLVIRYFFKTVRLIAGPIVLSVNWLTMPKGLIRTPTQQKKMDEKTKALTLYQYKTCPFCIRVRREKARLSLNIETRDAQHSEQHKQELQEGGGKIKVPCLKITNDDGSHSWLYESKAIIDYLRSNYSSLKA